MAHNEEIDQISVEREPGSGFSERQEFPEVGDEEESKDDLEQHMEEEFEEELEEDEQRQQRFTLSRRQIQMIAIGSSIGTGVLYDSGTKLASAGPGSLFLGVLLGGSVIYSVMITIGEMISTPFNWKFPYDSRSTSGAGSNLRFAEQFLVPWTWICHRLGLYTGLCS